MDNLVQAVEARPLLWLVDNIDLIKPVQKATKLPTISLEATQRSPLEHSGQYEITAESGVFIFQADNISAPFRLTVSEESVNNIGQYAQTLQMAAEDMELMEPFTRMSRAMEAVLESEGR